MAGEDFHPEYGELPLPAYDWPSPHVSVMNQAPVTSYTTSLYPMNQLHLVPGSKAPRAATVVAGDRAPDFELISSDDRRRVTLADFEGMPLILRFTRAVSETFV